MKKLKLIVDPKAYKEKPSDNDIAGIKARLQKNPIPLYVTIEELTSKISQGHSVSPAVMRGMSANDWQEQELFLVDIDNDREDVPILTLKQALAICYENNFPPAFCYQTFSYDKSKPKYRLAFIMDETITEPHKRQIIMSTLIALFPQSDKSCVNADRIFYGTNKNVRILDENARISFENILGAYTPPDLQDTTRAKFGQQNIADKELNELVRNFDLLGYMKDRNGEYTLTAKGARFKNCEICGHKDDLVYYSETNTWFCFSDKGAVGGSIIDYLIQTEGLTLKQAIQKAKELHAENIRTWQKPIPLGDVRLPQFPIESLPPIIIEYVKALAEHTQTPIDMCAAASLAVISSTVQGKFEIKGKDDYGEPLNLYVVIVASSGERKSAIVKAMTAPIYEYEKIENERRKPLIMQQHDKMDNLERLLERAKSKPDNKEEIERLRKEIEELEEHLIIPLCMIADNVTPEALTSLLAKNDGKISIISAEGGIFDILAGLYSNSGIASIDTMLKAHCGDTIFVDRKEREREFVERPTLTILLSIQPSVLEGVLKNKAFTTRGLSARMLYISPQSLKGNRKWQTNPIPQKVKENYENIIHSLLKISASVLRTIGLDDKAKKLLEEFDSWLEPQLAEKLEYMNGWAEKLLGTILRIAGNLHCAEHITNANKVKVTADTLQKAIDIGKYLLEHAKFAHSLMGTDAALQGAKRILRKLEGQSEQELSKSEIFHNMCRGEYRKTEEITSALNLLVEYGYLQEKEYPILTGGRPRKNTYLLNPLHFDKPEPPK